MNGIFGDAMNKLSPEETEKVVNQKILSVLGEDLYAKWMSKSSYAFGK